MRGGGEVMSQLIGRVFDELKQRRLPQTAGLYIAVAWGGTEILAFLVDSLFGESQAKEARRYLAILLVAGFPAAMYLAWTRDLGLRARRLLGAGVASVAVVALLIYLLPDGRGISTIDNSIAVLPFDVCEERISDRYLAKGLAAAIQGRLSDRGTLNVIGSESVQAVMQTGPSIPVVAGLLGVKYLLAGVVCREGRDPTVNVELLDDRGVVVWDNRFREVANEYDQVEVQLADLVDKAVARQFGDASAGRDTAVVAREALVQLRLAEGLLLEGARDRARAAYEKALEIQPGYPAALYGLAYAVMREPDSGSYAERRERWLEIVETALDTARATVQRDPRDFEASWIAGRILHDLGHFSDQIDYQGELREQSDRRYAEAQRYLDAALALRPENAEVRIWSAHNMGRLSVESRRASMDVLEQGLVNDPFNRELAKRLAVRMVEFGEVNRAMDVLDTFDQLPQGKEDVWWQQFLRLHGLGIHDRHLAYTVELLRDYRDHLEGVSEIAIWEAVLGLAKLGLYEEAEFLYALWINEPDDSWSSDDAGAYPLWFKVPYLYALGKVEEAGKSILQEVEGLSSDEVLNLPHRLANRIAAVLWESGEKERAIEIVEGLAQFRNEPTGVAEDQMRFPRRLADMYLGVGRESDAMAVLDGIIAFLEEEKLAGVRHPKSLMILASSYADQARRDEAIETLQMAIDYGAWDMSICCRDYLSEAVLEMLAVDGFPDPWERFEGDPEFELARTRMRSIVDAQRANIRALLKQNDLAELISPWIEAAEQS
jgi:tetratricopeptide (TPR) repeat protein